MGRNIGVRDKAGGREDGTALLAGLGLVVALCFLLEFSGIELMHGAGLLGQLLGFVVAYPLVCIAPILIGWWLAHRRHDDGADLDDRHIRRI